MSTVSVQTDSQDEFQIQLLPPLVVEKQKLLSAANIIQMAHRHYKTSTETIPSLFLQALMYYKYQEDFDAFAPQAIQNLRLLPYYSSALNLISHPAFPKEEKAYDLKVLAQGLTEIEQKIRRLHVDVSSCTRLNGTSADLFSIIARQLIKDKICDNLSVDVLEYLKHLLDIGVQIIDMKEKDLVQSLKNIVGYQDAGVLDSAKKEPTDGSACLQQTAPVGDRIKQSDSVVVIKRDLLTESMEVDSTSDEKMNESFVNPNSLVFTPDVNAESSPPPPVQVSGPENSEAAQVIHFLYQLLLGVISMWGRLFPVQFYRKHNMR